LPTEDLSRIVTVSIVNIRRSQLLYLLCSMKHYQTFKCNAAKRMPKLSAPLSAVGDIKVEWHSLSNSRVNSDFAYGLR
jgi:hypothetical protein